MAVTQPDGQFAVAHVDVLVHVQILLNLLHQRLLLCVEGVFRVIGQLYQQQRVDVVLPVGSGEVVAALQGLFQQLVVHLQLIRAFQLWIQFDAFLYHLLGYHLMARHLYQRTAARDGSGRNAQLYLGPDVLQHQFALLGVLAAEHVFLVYHHDDGQTLLLGASRQLVEVAVLLVVAYQHGILLVDALPVQEEHLTWLQSFGRVSLIEHHGTQRTGLAEEVPERHIALYVQFVGGYPDVGAVQELHLQVAFQFVEQS